MALKKSQLYSSLWRSCDELRGGMDASQYKDYVLTLLFMKYVSDKYAGKPYPLIEVPPGGGFADLAALKGDKEIGDRINKVIGRLADANDELKGVIDQADFNDESRLGTGKDMRDRLSRLVAIFEGLDLSENRAAGDDLLGDAYEYLMRHFATESGKSKGQFYTPAEVSRIIAQVVGIGPGTRQDQTIYDPACGSGSLLLKAADQAPGGLTIYGQEKDIATWALARMNLVLHGHPTAELWRGNTLADPYFKNPDGSLKPFDFAVANPPFSEKAWTNGLDPENDEFGRFEYGVPPARNGDYAFLLHLLRSLGSGGKGAIVLPHGVLFRGNREAAIRRNLVRRELIRGVIGLPANLFYGTGIPACIVVLDKAGGETERGVFLVDASRGFRKDGAKNRLREQDIHRIVDTFRQRTEIPGYSRMVPLAEVEANDYNLNLPRYLDSGEPEDLHDLDAHLRGGVPDRDVDALGAYWTTFPSLRATLFEADGRPESSAPRVRGSEVRGAVVGHREFRAYGKRVEAVFEGWREAHEPRLRGLGTGSRPAEIIRTLSEDLLDRFAVLPLLDRYDIYQRLMDYWDEAMSDDVHLVAAVGWVEAARPRLLPGGGGKKALETPDLTVARKKYKMDLIPPALIAARWFATGREDLDAKRAAREAASRELAEFVEERAGEEGLLSAVVGDNGKVTKAALRARMATIRSEPDSKEESAALCRCLELVEAESTAGKKAREAGVHRDKRVLARYARLTEAEIQALVVEDKWLARLRAAVDEEVNQLANRLAGRVKELDERYARPLPELEGEVKAFSAKVEGHLSRMGFTP